MSLSPVYHIHPSQESNSKLEATAKQSGACAVEDAASVELGSKCRNGIDTGELLPVRLLSQHGYSFFSTNTGSSEGAAGIRLFASYSVYIRWLFAS